MTNSPTAELQNLGVSIWLDDLSKDRLTSGSLAELMNTHHVVGVTSNPTIFAGSVAGSASYATDIAKLKAQGLSAEQAVFSIMVSDVQGACDLLHAEFERSGGLDGRVSLEVSPELAHDTQGTIAQAVDLWKQVDRANLMIKIPATKAGLPAITDVIAQGISVNVTLIFSLERYAEVQDAYFAGISGAVSAGEVSNERLKSIFPPFIRWHHSLFPGSTPRLIRCCRQSAPTRLLRCARWQRLLMPAWPMNSSPNAIRVRKPANSQPRG